MRDSSPAVAILDKVNVSTSSKFSDGDLVAPVHIGRAFDFYVKAEIASGDRTRWSWR